MISCLISVKSTTTTTKIACNIALFWIPYSTMSVDLLICSGSTTWKRRSNRWGEPSKDSLLMPPTNYTLHSFQWDANHKIVQILDTNRYSILWIVCYLMGQMLVEFLYFDASLWSTRVECANILHFFDTLQTV